MNGKLYCIDPETSGSIRWETQSIDSTSETGLSSTPLVIGDTVYVTAQNPAVLYGFNTETGDKKINISLGGSVARLSSPSCNNDQTMLFTSGDNGLVVVDPSNNTKLWNVSLGAAAGTPVYFEKNVYIATASTLYSISTENHAINWQITHEGHASAPIVTQDLIIANGNSGLTAYKLTTQEQVWNDPLNSSDFGQAQVSPNSPIMDSTNNIVYYTQNYHQGAIGYVHAVNLSTGELLWAHAQVNDENGFWANPVESEEWPTLKTHLQAGIGAPITYSSPALAQEVVFVGTGSGKVNDTTFKEAFGNWAQEVSETTYEELDIDDISEYLVEDVSEGPDNLWCFGKAANAIYTYDYNSLSSKNNPLIVYEAIDTTVDSVQFNSATVLGVLDAASTYMTGSMPQHYYNYTLSESSSESITITSISKTFGDGKVENTVLKPWYVWINDDSKGTEIKRSESVKKGDSLIFASGPDLTTAKYQYKMKVDEIKYPSVTLSTSPGNPGLTTKPVTNGESQIIYANIYDAKGKPITNPITWSTSGDVSISSSNNSSKWTITGFTTPSVTATTTINSRSYSSTLTFKVLTPEELISLIPKDPAIESTDTFFTYKGNYARTGVAKGEGPQSADILWVENFRSIGYPTLVDGHPVVVNGNVYFTTWGGGMSEGVTANGIYSYNAKSGTKNWYSDKITSRTGLTVLDGKIYGGNGGKLVCLDEKTGEQLWTTNDISYSEYVGLTSIPLVYNDTVYVSTVHKTSGKVTESLYEFSVTGDNNGNARELFRLDTGRDTGMYSSPAMAPGNKEYPAVVYVSGNGGIVAVDTTTNQVVWDFDAGARGQGKDSLTDTTDYGGNGMYVSGPVYKDGYVYFTVSSNTKQYTGDRGEGLYCLYAVTGDLKWHAKCKIEYANTPVVTDDKIVFTSVGLQVYNSSTGEKIGSYATLSNGRAAAVVAGDTAYFGTYGEGTLYAVDINTCQLVWKYEMEKISVGGTWYSLIEATPAISDGVLYVGSENGRFYGKRLS